MTKRLSVAAVHVTKSCTCDLGIRSSALYATVTMVTRYVITAIMANTTTNSCIHEWASYKGCQMAKFEPSKLAQFKERKGSNFAV